MRYSIPEEETLARYLALLERVLIIARFRAFEVDKQTAELLDAIHNIPDLLCRWPEMQESWVYEDLRKYEVKYCNGSTPFTNILKNGPGENWQQKWKANGEAVKDNDDLKSSE